MMLKSGNMRIGNFKNLKFPISLIQDYFEFSSM